MNTIDEQCVKVCNQLLRGELSAVETYEQAIAKYSDSPVAEKLNSIRSEHLDSTRILAEHVREMGGEPETDSGGWGAFARVIQGTANLFGADSAIESLQKGEEAGKSDYEDALRDDEVMASTKNLIRESLLPPIVNHIAELESLEKVA